MRIALSLLFAGGAWCYFLFEFVDEFARYYEDRFFPDSAGAWGIVGGALFITLYGACYPRISLTPYIAAMMYYNFREIKDGLDSVSPRTAEQFHVPPGILQGVKDMFDSSADDPASLIVMSLVLACILVWALEMVQNLLLIVGLYIVYRMFFYMGFETYKEESPEVFYGLLAMSFVVLYFVTSRVTKYLFLVVFGITGSLVLLASVEAVTESTSLGIYDMILDLKEMQALDSSSVTVPMGVWAVTALIGMGWQWRLVGDK